MIYSGELEFIVDTLKELRVSYLFDIYENKITFEFTSYSPSAKTSDVKKFFGSKWVKDTFNVTIEKEMLFEEAHNLFIYLERKKND